jgi:MOSC domain-containing protein YiiM
VVAPCLNQADKVETVSSSGIVEAIWIKRARRGPMDSVREARLLEGKGVEGNADRSRFRQVTVLEREAWDKCMSELGASLDPSTRRANVLVRGVELYKKRQQTLIIGSAKLLILGEVKPCERMEEALAGLRNAMRPEWRGGVFGQVTEGGIIRVGDPVHLVETT